MINNGGIIDEPMSQMTNENVRPQYFNDLSKKGFRNLSQMKPVGGPSALQNGNLLPNVKKLMPITDEYKQRGLNSRGDASSKEGKQTGASRIYQYATEEPQF